MYTRSSSIARCSVFLNVLFEVNVRLSLIMMMMMMMMITIIIIMPSICLICYNLRTESDLSEKTNTIIIMSKSHFETSNHCYCIVLTFKTNFSSHTQQKIELYLHDHVSTYSIAKAVL